MIFREIVIHDLSKSLRERAESRKVAGPYRWTPQAPGGERGFYCAGRWEPHGAAAASAPAVASHGAGFDLRLAWADEFTPRRSDLHGVAYFTDEDGMGDTMRPLVARLPHGRGFLAGWSMGPGMCAMVSLEIHATAEDAARAAHEETRIAAEREIEYQRSERARLDEEEARTAPLGTDE